MPPINRCSLDCPAMAAEQALCRHDQLRSSDTRRLAGLARLSIMSTALTVHAKYTCPTRKDLEDWQPSSLCIQAARTIMASRQFEWTKLTEHEQEVLAPYRTDESR